MRAVLVGNYGVGNAGDEALREYFEKAFPAVDWMVLSAAPKAGEYPRLPFGPRSFLLTPWLRTISAYRKADVIVFGGGSLLTDIEMVRACFIWWCHAALATFFGKPLLLAFQGIGPFRTKIGERLARAICKKAEFLSVRDQASADRVRSWRIATQIIQSFDPVFSLYEAKKCNGCSSDTLALIPRMNSGEAFRKEVKKVLEQSSDLPVKLLLLQADYPEEKRTGELLAKEYGVTPISIESLTDLATHFMHTRAVVTERYHAALLAFSMGVPVTIVSQKPGDKLDELRTLIQRGTKPSELHQLVANGEEALRQHLQ